MLYSRVYRSAGGENFGGFMGNNIGKRLSDPLRTLRIDTNAPLLCAFEITPSLQFTPKKPHFFKVPDLFRIGPWTPGGLGLTYVSGNFGVNTPMRLRAGGGTIEPDARSLSGF